MTIAVRFGSGVRARFGAFKPGTRVSPGALARWQARRDPTADADRYFAARRSFRTPGPRRNVPTANESAEYRIRTPF